MKDLIDQRNEREKIKKSIIKYWNVNYVPEVRKEDRSSMQEEHEETAAWKEMDRHDKKYWKQQESRLDEVTQGQIEQILHENADKIHEMFDDKEHM